MAWLDPVECEAARDCLEKGNVLEAARLLIESPQREHKAARRMLLEIGQRLVERALEANERGDATAAWEALTRAEQCAALSPEAAALRDKLARERAEQEQQQAWHDERLGQARQWADEGRVRSALGKIEALTDTPDVQRCRQDWEEQLARFERYLQECREHKDQGDVQFARQRLKLAQDIMPGDPEVLRLAKELRDLEPVPKEIPRPISRPINHRSQGFALGSDTLVLLAHEVVIGTRRGDGVHIPIMGPLHSRHAVILRKHGRYRLVPCLDRHGQVCDVRISGEPVKDIRALHDGDVLELGGSQCAWMFRLPVPDSTTAVLEPAKLSSDGVRTPDGSEFRRVVLLGERLRVSATLPAHVVMPSFPCEALILNWANDGLTAQVQGGTLTVEDATDDVVSPEGAILVPGRLVVRLELDEAERLGRAFTGCDLSEEFRLAVRDPFRKPTRPRVGIQTTAR